MDSARLEDYCRQGEKADTYLTRGRTRDALTVYLQIVSKLEETGEVDSYLMAKIALGTLRCYVKLGDFKNAYQVWNSTLDDGLFGVGIYALESAQTTVHDMIIYDMLCGFLHTLADTERQEAAHIVNQYMSRVCEHALEQGEKSVFRLAVNNWKHHLRDIFQGTIPHESAAGLIKFKKQLGEPVKADPIDFPLPAQWEKPNDFREMSRVVQMKNTPLSQARTRTKRRPTG